MTDAAGRVTIEKIYIAGVIHTAYTTYQTHISYSDVGPDQRLNHRGALRLLQEAAALASDQRGYGLKDIQSKGVCWILSGWRLELSERPLWPAPLAVHTWPRSMEGFSSDRDFELFSGERQIGRATSRWLLVNSATGRVTRVTDAVRAAYDLDSRALFDTPISSNGKSPADAALTFSTTVGRRDIDTNQHVNNIHYLDYALEALPEPVLQDMPATVEIVFRRQILLGTPIRCLYAFSGGRHQVEIQSGPADHPVHHAFLWLY